jgi:hypothetical protein
MKNGVLKNGYWTGSAYLIPVIDSRIAVKIKNCPEIGTV